MNAAVHPVGPDPKWGIVVIGRNEARRLEAVLDAATSSGRPVVYVDSGSTDGSRSIAERAGVIVTSIPPGSAPSAALARNVGARLLVHTDQTIDLIQFVDGDCELTADWIATGPAALAGDEGCAAVCGYRHEARPRRNLFHRAAEQEWRLGGVGDVAEFGGDVLVRRSWFERVGGYDPSVVAGEDPELSARLRTAGGRIRRLDLVATVHDIGMDSVRQWWRRAERGGYGAAAVAGMYQGPDRPFADQVRRMTLWGGVAPVIAVAGLAWSPLPAIGLGLRWIWSTFRAGSSVTNPSADARDRLAWGVSCACAAVPGAVGIARYRLERRRGEAPSLLEYRRPNSGRRASGSADNIPDVPLVGGEGESVRSPVRRTGRGWGPSFPARRKGVPDNDDRRHDRTRTSGMGRC